MIHRGGQKLKLDWDLRAVLGFRFGCAVISVLASTLTATVAATGNAKQSVSGVIAFNIPSQPLGTALEIYARISRREVLYDGRLAAGRSSGLVDGLYKPEVALQILLAGTGLWADFKDADFFLVGLAPTEKTASRSDSRQSGENKRYYGRLQASLKAAFCGNSVLPDSNRVAAQLWVGQQGQVLQVKKLGSSGNGELDQQVETVLRGLRLICPPPAGFAQPITIVIMPSAPGANEDCNASGVSPAEARP